MLTFDRYNFDAVGIRALSLMENLTHLTLFDIDIDDEGAVQLAGNNNLTHLCLRGCGIGNLGASALLRNTHLINLDLRENGIDEIPDFVTNRTLLHFMISSHGSCKQQIIETAKIRNTYFPSLYQLSMFCVVNNGVNRKELPQDIKDDISKCPCGKRCISFEWCLVSIDEEPNYPYWTKDVIYFDQTKICYACYKYVNLFSDVLLLNLSHIYPKLLPRFHLIQ